MIDPKDGSRASQYSKGGFGVRATRSVDLRASAANQLAKGFPDFAVEPGELHLPDQENFALHVILSPVLAF
jgi:hypothetical protein